MPTNKPRPLWDRAPRVDRYEGKQCAVPGCPKDCRAMSRYCLKHAQRQFRSRDPMGRMARPKELIPYRELAQFHLENDLKDHPALKAAEDYLAGLLTHDGFPEKYRKHMERLRIGGASGRGLLLSVLSVYGLSHYGHAKAFTSDQCFFTNLGNRFLRTAPLYWKKTSTGKLDQDRPTGLDCEVLGRALGAKVGGVCILFWRRVDSTTETNEARERHIRDMLEKHPL